MNPAHVDVSVYMINGRLKAQISLNLGDLTIERHASGQLKEEARRALEKAMEESLSKWELNVQITDKH